MAFRLLHMADIHLDTPFAGQVKHRARMRSAQRTALTSAVDAALREQVHAVLIAGDLLDGENQSFASMAVIYEQLDKLVQKGIPVFYAPGNHDPWDARGFTMPRGITVFDSTVPRSVPVQDTAGQTVGMVVGVGYTHTSCPDNLALNFPGRESDLPTVGLLHTQLVEIGGQNTPYAPCSIRDLERVGYDYWALGHVHARRTLGSYGQIHYPGCLCGRDYSESGPKGVSLVEISKSGKVDIRFLPMAPLQWLDVTMDHLDNLIGLEAVTHAVTQELLKNMESMPGAQMIARVTLKGPTECYRQLTQGDAQENIETMERMVARRLDALDVSIQCQNIQRTLHPEEFRNQAHLLSEALTMLDEGATQNGTMDTLAHLIQSNWGLYGVQGNNTVAMREYLRSLLPGLDALLCDRIIKEEN